MIAGVKEATIRHILVDISRRFLASKCGVAGVLKVMLRQREKPGAIAAIALALSGAATHADNWPQWRGPDASGVSAETGLPIVWSSKENILWKADLPGAGTSTPVVWNEHVYVTAQTGGGPTDERGAQFPETNGAPVRPSDDGAVVLVVAAFERSTGRLAWEYRVAADRPLPPVHRNHNLATPSVVTDGDGVYAWFGTGQLVALDINGVPLWKRHLGQDYAPFEILWGHGSSPVLHGDALYLLCDHAPRGYLLALDKRTGKEIWRAVRGEGLRSYSTPVIVHTAGRDELIVNSSRSIDAHDPRTGRLLWFVDDPVELSIPVPSHQDGVIYTSRGYASSPYLAITAGGSGNVTATSVRWRISTSAPYVSSLLLYRGLLYMATETGILTVTDATSGEIVWRQRLGGSFTASPVAADGHVYLLNENGETAVLEAGRQPRIVARNPIGERSLASLAMSGGLIFLRTDQHLYAIGGGR
jgi:outer membrane protein assembly factor BamB